jgi:hypothetical protein
VPSPIVRIGLLQRTWARAGQAQIGRSCAPQRHNHGQAEPPILGDLLAGRGLGPSQMLPMRDPSLGRDFTCGSEGTTRSADRGHSERLWAVTARDGVVVSRPVRQARARVRSAPYPLRRVLSLAKDVLRPGHGLCGSLPEPSRLLAKLIRVHVGSLPRHGVSLSRACSVATIWAARSLTLTLVL